MRVSLRLRVFALLAFTNLLVFAAGMAFFQHRLEVERGEFTSGIRDLLFSSLQRNVKPRGELQIAPILRWPYWERFEDAILLGRSWLEQETGPLEARGAFLNPVGRGARSLTLDERAVLRGMRDAVRSGEVVAVEGGTCVPVHDLRGEVWGGCWYLLAPDEDTPTPFATLLPWFLVSLLLSTLTTFAVLGRFVLEPVEDLASTAKRVSAGDFSARAVPLSRPGDELSALTTAFNDMAERMEGYNRRLADDIAEATTKMRLAEAAAMRQRRLAAMGELAAGIAHEINNPLGGLINAVETLSREDLPAERRERYRTLVHDGLERIRGIVSKLLRVTPRTSIRARFSPLDPAWDALALVRHRAQQGGFELVLLAGPERRPVVGDADLDAARARLPEVLGERNELGQALLNLLTNALDALEADERPKGRRGSHVAVEVAARGADKVTIEVRDDGPGMAAADLERAPDLFFTTKEVGQGTGLGLCASRALPAPASAP